MQVLAKGELHLWHWARQRDARLCHEKRLEILRSYTRETLRDADIAKSPRGKPYMQRAQGEVSIEFNVSHARDMTVMVLSDAVIGIDLANAENFPDLGALAACSLSDREADAFNELDPSRRAVNFLRCWTRKEAYLKARGIGLAIEPKLIDTTRSSINERTHAPSEWAGKHIWHWQELKLGEDYVAAVATPFEHATIRSIGAA